MFHRFFHDFYDPFKSTIYMRDRKIKLQMCGTHNKCYKVRVTTEQIDEYDEKKMTDENSFGLFNEKRNNHKASEDQFVELQLTLLRQRKNDWIVKVKRNRELRERIEKISEIKHLQITQFGNDTYCINCGEKVNGN